MQNNPIRYSDPTGHKECDLQWDCGDGVPPQESPNMPIPDQDPSEPSVEHPGESNNCALNDLGCILGKNKEELSGLANYCVQNPYTPDCAQLLPPDTCIETPAFVPTGTPYYMPGCRFVGTNSYVDPSKIDWLGIVSNGLGILGTIALGVSTITGPGVWAGLGVYEATQITGIAIDVYRHDSRGLSITAISSVVGEVKGFGKVVPGFGVLINIAAIDEIINDAIVTKSIYEPYPRPRTIPLPLP